MRYTSKSHRSTARVAALAAFTLLPLTAATAPVLADPATPPPAVSIDHGNGHGNGHGGWDNPGPGDWFHDESWHSWFKPNQWLNPEWWLHQLPSGSGW